MRRWLGWLEAPAVHFALAGGLLFVAAGALVPEGAGERPEVSVSASEVEQARQEIGVKVRRSLTPEEEELARRLAVDRALLFRLALDLGLDRQPEIERRLAQIAAFVGESPDAADTVETAETVQAETVHAETVHPEVMPQPAQAEVEALAAEARALGLHRGDRVVRSLLVDRARRLIRAAVLVHEPTEEALEAHWREHAERYRAPAETALDVLVLGRGVTAAEASARLARLRAAGEVAGDDVASWPALAAREIDRRLGRDVTAALPELAAGEWSAPLRSRDGTVLVRVRERVEPRTQPLDRVRDEVRAEVRQQLADRWLEERLGELRLQYRVVIEEPKGGQERLAEARLGERRSS